MSDNVEKLLQAVESLPRDKQAEAVAVATAYLNGLKQGREMEKSDQVA